MTTHDAEDDMDKIGFVGVGAMGGSIAARLSPHHELLVNDRNPDATARLVGLGAKVADLPDLAAQCATVFICLPGPQQVRDLVIDGDQPLAELLRPGSVLVDITSSIPGLDHEIAAVLGERGVDFVDCPIAGGVSRAQQGTATLMAGGSDAAFARVEPLLLEIADTVVHVGPTGTGHAMKLVNNLLNACNRYAALETVHLAELAGIERSVALDVINRASGRNFTTEFTFPLLLSGENWKPQNFTLELWLKDVRLANELADSLGHQMPIGRIALANTQRGVTRFGPRADQSQLMFEWYDDQQASS
jgi:3-hydroxyisobutyrate dehydrogenase